MSDQSTDKDKPKKLPKSKAYPTSHSAAESGNGSPGRVGTGTHSPEAAVSHDRVRSEDGYGPNTESASFVKTEVKVYGDEEVRSSIESAGLEPAARARLREREAIPAGLLSYGDSFAARTERAVQRLRVQRPEFASLISHGPRRATIESVVGDDTRYQVYPTSYPHSAVCMIVSEFLKPNGDYLTTLGTGWIVGKRTVITAGHVVFAHSQKVVNGRTWAEWVTVFPARSGDAQGTAPPYAYSTQRLRSTRAWRDEGYEAGDYGAIIVEQDLPYELGIFGYGSQLDVQYREGPIRVTGYPGELQGTDYEATIWEDYGTVIKNGAQLSYQIDTTRGQSGGPVYYINKSDDPAKKFARAVGIHNYGIEDPTGGNNQYFSQNVGETNSATYIIGTVDANLDAWLAEGGGT